MALSLSAMERYLIRDTVQDYRNKIQSTFPLTDLSDFYEEARLKDEFKLEKRNIIEAFMPKISIVGTQKRDVIMKDLNTQLRKFEESYLARNASHREKTSLFSEKLEDFLCAQYEVSSESYLALNAYTEIEPLHDFLENEKLEVISHLSQLTPGNEDFRQNRKVELEVKLEILQMEAENKQKEFLQGPVEEERKCFEDLKEGLLAKCEELKTYIARSKLAFIPKCFLQEKVEGLENFVNEKGIFLKPEFSQIHKEILESLKGAVTGLYLAEEKLLPENAASWAEDLDQQLKSSFIDSQGESPRDQEHVYEEQMNTIEVSEDLRSLADSDEPREPLENASSTRSPNSSPTHSMDLDRSETENNANQNSGEADNVVDRIPEAREKRRTRSSGRISGTNADSTASKRLRLEASITPAASSTATEEAGSPLIFRLETTSVVMGALDGELFKKLRNWKGEKSTPSVVGIDDIGTLVCGTDAMSCEEQWPLADFIGKFDSEIFWKKNVTFKLNGEENTREITVEFLLGFLFKSLRDCAERTMKQRFDVAIIIVPVWFCSSHRIQVKDAARIAGFRKIRLVNEETVAANIASELPQLPEKPSEKKNVLVISENFEVITAILYQYCGSNTNKPKLTMHQHSHLKKTEFLRESKMKEQVEEIYADVLEGALPDYVTFLGTSKICRWFNTFKAVANEKKYKSFTSGDMFGAGSLCKMTLAQMDSMAQEYLFKEIVFPPRGRDQVYTLQKHQNQNALPKQYTITIAQKNLGSESTSRIKFSQKNVRDEKAPGVHVGELDVSAAFEYAKNNLSRRFSKSPKLQAILKVDVEGIAYLERVECTDSGETMEVKDFEWITQNLTDGERDEFVRIIQAI